jgi:glycosyltransferase involved in cell wall biosynthesis
MKIIVVSPTPTHPPSAGNRARILSMTQALKELGHEVHFAFATLETADRDAMEAYFGRDRLHWMEALPTLAQRSPFKRARRFMLRCLRVDAAYRWGIDDWYDPALTPRLKALQSEHHFDAVFVEYVFMSKAFEAFGSGCLKVLDTHDVFGDRHRIYLDAGQSPQWYSTAPADEDLALKRADVVLAIQEAEAQVFKQRLHANDDQVITLGHLLHTSRRVSGCPALSAVFLASSNHINVVAAQYFIDAVLPLILLRHPEFKLFLAGNICDAIADGPGLVKLGRVNHVLDAFDRASVAVNPVTMGTGLNIKLLDAMAAGMPIVSTDSGVRGLTWAQREGIAVVPDQDPQAMAQAVVAAVENPAQSTRMADIAYRQAQLWNKAQMTTLQSTLLKSRHAEGVCR